MQINGDRQHLRFYFYFLNLHTADVGPIGRPTARCVITYRAQPKSQHSSRDLS